MFVSIDGVYGRMRRAKDGLPLECSTYPKSNIYEMIKS